MIKWKDKSVIPINKKELKQANVFMKTLIYTIRKVY
jgi:hypothetical protein